VDQHETPNQRLVKYLQVLVVEIRGDIETLKRSIAGSYAVDRDEEFGLRGERFKLVDHFDLGAGGRSGCEEGCRNHQGFTYDVYNTVKHIHNNLDQTAVVTNAAKIVGTDNEFALLKATLDKDHQ